MFLQAAKKGEVISDMKIKLQDAFAGCIVFLIILNLGILNIADLTTVYRYITSAVALILGIGCLCSVRVYARIKRYCHFMNIWLIVLFVFLFFEVLYGWAVGVNSLTKNLSYIYIYFWLLLFYPIIYILTCNNGKKRLIYSICLWTIVALTLKTTVWFLYNYLHKDVMHYLLFEFGSEWIRNGFQRIPATCFSGVLVCAMLYVFYNTTKIQIKIMSCVIILFNMWYALMVFASRAQMICLVFAMSVAILLRRNMGIKKMVTYLVFILVAAIAMSTVYFNEFVQGMSLTTYSMGMRVKELIYYWDLIGNHWILGFLYVFSDDKIHGPMGTYYLSDLGLFSKLFETGIIGITIHLLPFARIFFDCRKYMKRSNKEFVFAVALMVYTICVSFLSNDIYSFRLLFGFPFILAYYESLKNTELSVDHV